MKAFSGWMMASLGIVALYVVLDKPAGGAKLITALAGGLARVYNTLQGD